MVDNVDKGLWITHTGFLNNDLIAVSFTHGKTNLKPYFLQDFLPYRGNGAEIGNDRSRAVLKDACRNGSDSGRYSFMEDPYALWRKGGDIAIL